MPAAAGGGALTSLTRDGAPVAVVPRTVKGVDYAVFAGEPGAYVATYPPAAGPSGPTRAGPAGARADRTKPRVTLRKRTVRVRRKGRVMLVVALPAGEVRCTIDVRLQRKGKRLARKRLTVAGGKSAKVRLRLSRSARRRAGDEAQAEGPGRHPHDRRGRQRATQRIGVTLHAPLVVIIDSDSYIRMVVRDRRPAAVPRRRRDARSGARRRHRVDTCRTPFRRRRKRADGRRVRPA